MEERAGLRRARDFAAADLIRRRLLEGGWEVVDGVSGSRLRAVEAPPRLRTVSYLAVLHGWPEDGERWLRSIEANPGGIDFEVLLALNASGSDLANWAAGRASDRVRTLEIEPPAGFGSAVNLAVKAAAGQVMVLMDPGTELDGEVAGPLLEALSRPGAGLAGAFGLRGRGTAKEFAEHPGPEVDALEGYCVAFRRRDFLAVGGYDEKFRFYRIGDIEFSFRMRAAGHRALALPLPVRRHAHRLWEATPEEERERLSRKNLYRFLDRWGKRPDLLLG